MKDEQEKIITDAVRKTVNVEPAIAIAAAITAMLGTLTLVEHQLERIADAVERDEAEQSRFMRVMRS